MPDKLDLFFSIHQGACFSYCGDNQHGTNKIKACDCAIFTVTLKPSLDSNASCWWLHSMTLMRCCWRTITASCIHFDVTQPSKTPETGGHSHCGIMRWVLYVPWLYVCTTIIWTMATFSTQSDRDCSQNWHTVTKCSTILCHCMLRGEMLNYE